MTALFACFSNDTGLYRLSLKQFLRVETGTQEEVRSSQRGFLNSWRAGDHIN
jgi:hypothetical protein